MSVLHCTYRVFGRPSRSCQASTRWASDKCSATALPYNRCSAAGSLVPATCHIPPSSCLAASTQCSAVQCMQRARQYCSAVFSAAQCSACREQYSAVVQCGVQRSTVAHAVLLVPLPCLVQTLTTLNANSNQSVQLSLDRVGEYYELLNRPYEVPYKTVLHFAVLYFCYALYYELLNRPYEVPYPISLYFAVLYFCSALYYVVLKRPYEVPYPTVMHFAVLYYDVLNRPYEVPYPTVLQFPVLDYCAGMMSTGPQTRSSNGSEDDAAIVAVVSAVACMTSSNCCCCAGSHGLRQGPQQILLSRGVSAAPTLHLFDAVLYEKTVSPVQYCSLSPSRSPSPAAFPSV